MLSQITEFMKRNCVKKAKKIYFTNQNMLDAVLNAVET